MIGYDDYTDWDNQQCCANSYCESEYCCLLNQAFEEATLAVSVIKDVFLRENYCDNYEEVCQELSSFICASEHLMKTAQKLTENFDGDCFECEDQVFLAFLRAAVTSQESIRLTEYLLTLCFCNSMQQMRFFVESLRRLNNYADANFTGLQLAISNLRGECR